jgi:predicted DNA binding protein
MRELSFTLTYEPGCNAVAETLAAHPDAAIRSLSLHATSERLWRVDHATGPADALDAVEEAFLTADYYADCLATDHCGATQRTQVLEHGDERLVLYSYWERTPACASVPHIALDHLGAGALFETRHEQREYTWRIIHPGGDVRGFFDALEAAVEECATIDIGRLTEVTSPTAGTGTGTGELPPEQEAALRGAVDHGYYETPRAVDLGDLAEILDVPRSTLAYRLRRAEAHLAERYTQHGQSSEGVPTSL